MSFTQAVLSLAAERFSGFRLKLNITSQDVAKTAVCVLLTVLCAMLQTTVFTRFRPFGAVPDLMLCLSVAVAFSEGERSGAVCGLASAFVIECLGGVGMTLLPLLYMPAGFVCGLLAKNYLSDSVAARAALISACAAGRGLISMICASVLLEANLLEIIADIVIPEYFSTLLLSAAVYALVWLCLRRFHKTRAERTEKLRQ